MKTANNFACSECGKGFGSDVELRIHQKVKHKESALVQNDNINSSDLSEDEEQGIKRFRGQFVKKPQGISESAKPVNKIEGKNDGEETKQTDVPSKPPVPGRFDDPSILQDEFKKIYLCGCQHRTFDSSAALSMHIKKQHNGFPPQGTLYGVSRDLVRRQFQPVEERQPVIRPHIQKTGYVCGCGLSYTRLSSLRFHIRTIHNSETPFGTIGLTKGPLSRQIDQGNAADSQGDASDSRSSNENREEYRQI